MTLTNRLKIIREWPRELRRLHWVRAAHRLETYKQGGMSIYDPEYAKQLRKHPWTADARRDLPLIEEHERNA